MPSDIKTPSVSSKLVGAFDETRDCSDILIEPAFAHLGRNPWRMAEIAASTDVGGPAVCVDGNPSSRGR